MVFLVNFTIGLIRYCPFLSDPHLLLFSKPSTPLPTPTPNPSLSPSPTPYIAKPSKYTTDSAILQIEKDLERIQNDLQKVNLKEEELIPPQIDTQITIE